MKKKNLWNKIFHKKVIKEQQALYEKFKRMSGFYSDIHHGILNAKTLTSLIEIHKMAWKIGYRNENLAPCPWGMFRTKNIMTMSPNEVYLGDIWGLWTNTVSFWDEHAELKMGDNGFGIDPEEKIYNLIMSQYRSLLKSNVNYLRSEADKFIYEYESVNKPKSPLEII